MKKAMAFWCGSLFGMLLACGSAVAAADPLEQHFGEYSYVFEDNYCSGRLTFQKGEHGAYQIQVDTVCGGEEALQSGRARLCNGEFSVSVAQKISTGTVLRDSQYGGSFTVTSKGIDMQNMPTAEICADGAYMNGLYIRKASAPTPKETEEPKELTLCGTVQSEKAIGYDAAQVAFLEYKDEEDFYERKFKDGRVTIFYDDNKTPNDEFSAPCSQLVSQSLKRKLMFCFSVTQKPTPAELKKQGVKESTIYWGDNCSVPD